MLRHSRVGNAVFTRKLPNLLPLLRGSTLPAGNAKASAQTEEAGGGYNRELPPSLRNIPVAP